MSAPLVLGEWSEEQPNRSGWFHVWQPRAWKDKQQWGAYWCLERLCWSSAYFIQSLPIIPNIQMPIENLAWKDADYRFKWRSVGDTFSTNNALTTKQEPQ